MRWGPEPGYGISVWVWLEEDAKDSPCCDDDGEGAAELHAPICMFIQIFLALVTVRSHDF